jgi:hypothetical protein
MAMNEVDDQISEHVDPIVIVGGYFGRYSGQDLRRQQLVVDEG